MGRVRAKIFAIINYSHVLNKEGQEVRVQSLHFDQVYKVCINLKPQAAG